MKTITYIFPVYNNAPSLRRLYDEMCEMTGTIAEHYDHLFIFVNDGSSDDSATVLSKLAADDPAHVRVLSLSRNFGHQAAVSAGMDRARGDAVVVMDADLQDPPAVCLELIRKWEEGFQVVYAQRRSRQDGLVKRATASLYYRLLSSMSTVDIPRNTGDFRLVDRVVVEVLCGMREYHRFLRGMYGYAGFRHAPVPFDRQGRQFGRSEYTFRRLLRLAKDGVFGFSDAPLKLATTAGLAVTALAVLGGTATLLAELFSAANVPDWSVTSSLLALVGGVQLIVLGIMGEYIARIHDEVRRRPTYIVEGDLNGDQLPGG